MTPREINEWVKQRRYEEYQEESRQRGHVDAVAEMHEMRQEEFEFIMREKNRK